jgi:hypothetical protein
VQRAAVEEVPGGVLERQQVPDGQPTDRDRYVAQAAHVDWYVNGGDLPAKVSAGFKVLEQGPALSIEPSRRADTAATS